MSGTGRSQLLRYFKRALDAWPRDKLRPECQLQDVLAKRLESKSLAPGTTSLDAEYQQLNALYSLLDNRYQTKYRIQGQLMEPRSKPTYYADLIKELDEAPTRTFLGRMRKRLEGMFRLR